MGMKKMKGRNERGRKNRDKRYIDTELTWIDGRKIAIMFPLVFIRKTLVFMKKRISLLFSVTFLHSKTTTTTKNIIVVRLALLPKSRTVQQNNKPKNQYINLLVDTYHKPVAGDFVSDLIIINLCQKNSKKFIACANEASIEHRWRECVSCQGNHDKAQREVVIVTDLSSCQVEQRVKVAAAGITGDWWMSLPPVESNLFVILISDQP